MLMQDIKIILAKRTKPSAPIHEHAKNGDGARKDINCDNKEKEVNLPKHTVWTTF